MTHSKTYDIFRLRTGNNNYKGGKKNDKGILFRSRVRIISWICNAIVIFVGEDASKYVDYSILIFLGIVISLIIYAGYCIFNEAYIALNETPKRTIIAFLVIGIANLGLFCSHQAIGHGFEKMDSSYINLICGFAMFVIAGLIGIKQLIDKREEA